MARADKEEVRGSSPLRPTTVLSRVSEPQTPNGAGCRSLAGSSPWSARWRLALPSLAGPPFADTGLGHSGLRDLLRGIRPGDHFAGGIQHRFDYGAIKSSGKPDDDPAMVR